jgi:hypothetical protein
MISSGLKAGSSGWWVLQERYGWARQQAEEEITRRLDASRMEDAGRR